MDRHVILGAAIGFALVVLFITQVAKDDLLTAVCCGLFGALCSMSVHYFTRRA
jgi:uncharacterized membrane protein YccC